MSGPVAGDPARAPAVRDMFARIAPGYDRANRLMSMGIDQLWRAKALRLLGEAKSGDMLDLCAGTLDFSLALSPHAKSIVALDFCAPMLEVGRARLPNPEKVRIICADARDMPLEDGSIDGIVAGFGIRNVPEPHRAVAECLRVLRPGGVMVVVDFFRPESLMARFFSSTYNRIVLPVVGGLVTGDASAYRYLAESMAAWASREEFEQMCKTAGFATAEGAELFPPVAAWVRSTKAGNTTDSGVR
jgi:demethylmenaquinone methyltransferase / 2-methoxy-6-polyprenyl-1,4-benzoquinol methylase